MFGMGTGVSLPLWPPSNRLMESNHLELLGVEQFVDHCRWRLADRSDGFDRVSCAQSSYRLNPLAEWFVTSHVVIVGPVLLRLWFCLTLEYECGFGLLVLAGSHLVASVRTPRVYRTRLLRVSSVVPLFEVGFELRCVQLLPRGAWLLGICPLGQPIHQRHPVVVPLVLYDRSSQVPIHPQ